MSEHHGAASASLPSEPRRSFLTTTSGLAMVGGLAAGYGMFATMLGRFAYPTAAQNRGWLFVCTVDALAPGEAMDFTSPAGAKIVIARQGEGTSDADYLALTWSADSTGNQKTTASSALATTGPLTAVAIRSPGRPRLPTRPSCGSHSRWKRACCTCKPH
jgi:hypothetical protein